MSFFKKFFGKKEEEDLDKGLEKSKTGFFTKISKAIAGKSTVDEHFQSKQLSRWKTPTATVAVVL